MINLTIIVNQINLSIMKNLLLTTVMFIFITSMSYAQFGVRLGANMANFSVDDDVEYKSKLGFSAGVFYKLKAGDKLAIQPELNLVQQGSKLEDDGVDVTLSANYIQIPVLLKYAFGNAEKTNFFIQAGPYVGIGVGKIKLKSCAGEDCETEEEDFGEETLKSSDFGLNLGAGVNINSKLSIDIRYGLGLSDIDSEDDISAKNTAINLGVGYTF